MPKPSTVWITVNCGKFWKRWEYQTNWPTSWETCMQVRKHQLELDMEQQTVQIGKGVHQGCILSPCLFNSYAECIMRNAGLEETQGGIKIARRNINNLRYADDTNLMAESEEELKSLLMKVKEEREKVGLKLNIQKIKIMASGPITSWEIDRETVKTVSDFIFVLQSQSLNHVQYLVTPWTAACQSSLYFTVSQSLLKLISIELVMAPNQLILCHPLLLLPSIIPSIRVFFK